MSVQEHAGDDIVFFIMKFCNDEALKIWEWYSRVFIINNLKRRNYVKESMFIA